MKPPAIIIIAIAMVVLIGALLYQSNENNKLQEELNRRSQGRAAPVASTTVAQVPPKSTSAEIESLRQENQRLKDTLDTIGATSGDGVGGKVNRLRDILARLPEQSIPEMQFLTDDDWYAAVDGPLESVEDYRIALSRLRGRAERHFAANTRPALAAFMSAHSGEFPKHVTQLKPFFEGQVDDAVLQRYKIVPAKEVPNLKMGGEWVITQTNRVDSGYDSVLAIGPSGFGTSYRRTHDGVLLDPVIEAFKKANPGVPPNDPAVLLPYASTKEQRSAIERLKRGAGR